MPDYKLKELWLLYTKICRFMHLSVKYTITKNCVGACQRYGNRRKREQ